MTILILVLIHLYVYIILFKFLVISHNIFLLRIFLSIQAKRHKFGINALWSLFFSFKYNNSYTHIHLHFQLLFLFLLMISWEEMIHSHGIDDEMKKTVQERFLWYFGSREIDISYQILTLWCIWCSNDMAYMSPVSYSVYNL